MWFFDLLLWIFEMIGWLGLIFYVLVSFAYDITPVGNRLNPKGGGDGEEVDGAVAMAMYGSME